MTLDDHQLDKKNIFIYDMHCEIYGLWEEFGGTPEPPQKNVSLRKCDFSGT